VDLTAAEPFQFVRVERLTEGLLGHRAGCVGLEAIWSASVSKGNDALSSRCGDAGGDATSMSFPQV
jgi:hypothetical protein